MESRPVYLLDSYALLAYLNGEPGGKRVQEILTLSKDNQCQVCMSWINLGEVLYITERNRGLSAAQTVQALAESLPIKIIEVSRDLILDAAHIKAHFPLSYADAFAVSTAVRMGAMIITGDPEFHEVQGLVNIEWLN